MTRLIWISLVITGTTVPSAAQDIQPERRCQLMIERAGELLREALFAGNENWYGGGGVQMRCEGEQVFIQSDSAVMTNGQFVQFIDRAQYRDDDVTIDADTLMYNKAGERLQAIGNVSILNKLDGATLEGPRVDYLREAEGVRDSAEIIAVSSDTRRFIMKLPVTAVDGDTTAQSPYLITAAAMRQRGSLTRAWGDVTIDRDSMAGRGDTLVYLSGESDEATLVGNPATMIRTGADSFTVSGSVVTLGLLGEEISSIAAAGDGRVIGSSGDILGDRIILQFEDGLLAHTESWGGKSGAQVLADGYDVRGDSIAIDTPGELLTELRVFGAGSMVEPLDTTALAPSDTTAAGDDPEEPIRNTIGGNSLTATFVEYDSAGTALTKLERIVAIGSATSLFSRDVVRNGQPSPTINYTRADTIIVVMETGDSSGVSSVRAFGNVDGVQLEQGSLGGTSSFPAVARPGRGNTEQRRGTP